MATYFLSDPHFSHKNIIKYEPIYRPFRDTDAMDELIINNYNATVDEGDLVFWLGDMFFCNASRMDYIVSRLKPTRNILIRGNHDKGITNSKFVKLGFEPHKMYLYGEYLLTHEPLTVENLNLVRQCDRTIKNVHGHVHSTFTGLPSNLWQCVSLEMIGMKPISEEELCDRFYPQYTLEYNERW